MFPFRKVSEISVGNHYIAIIGDCLLSDLCRPHAEVDRAFVEVRVVDRVDDRKTTRAHLLQNESLDSDRIALDPERFRDVGDDYEALAASGNAPIPEKTAKKK